MKTSYSMIEMTVEVQMNKQKTKNLAFMSLFIAIEILMVMVPFLGFIPIGPLRATTLHIPVIIAGIVLGKNKGAQVGLVFWLIKSIYKYNSANHYIFCFLTIYKWFILEFSDCDHSLGSVLDMLLE